MPPRRESWRRGRGSAKKQKRCRAKKQKRRGSQSWKRNMVERVYNQRSHMNRQHGDASDQKQRWCVTLLLRPHVTNAFPTDIHFVLHIWFFWLSVPVAKVKMDLHKPKVWHSVTCTSTTSQQLVSCADIHVIVFHKSNCVFVVCVPKHAEVQMNWQYPTWSIFLRVSSWGKSHITSNSANNGIDFLCWCVVLTPWIPLSSPPLLGPQLSNLHFFDLSWAAFARWCDHACWQDLCATPRNIRAETDGGVARIGLTWG